MTRDDRPTYPTPEYAPDGVLAGDWRLVRRCSAGGRVKCFGNWWEHEKLASFVGKWVWVQAGEYWIVWVAVYEVPYDPDHMICKICP